MVKYTIPTQSGSEIQTLLAKYKALRGYDYVYKGSADWGSVPYVKALRKTVKYWASMAAVKAVKKVKSKKVVNPVPFNLTGNLLFNLRGVDYSCNLATGKVDKVSVTRFKCKCCGMTMTANVKYCYSCKSL